MANELWVFSEKSSFLAELISGGRMLAEKMQGSVTALVLGAREEAEKAISLGADKVLWLGEPDPAGMVEDYVPTVANLVKDKKPRLLLIGATKRGKAVAGRLGGRLGCSVITDVRQFSDDDKLVGTHMIFGGGALRVEKAKTETTLATVGMSTYEALATDSGRKGEISEVPFVKPEWTFKVREHKEKVAVTVNLGAAKRVVSVGRGLGKEEDLEMIRELAKAMEAEVGCTRPLAEGLDWLPRERYIGVSGAFVKPEVFLSVGVSGQVQHMVGATESRLIAAIDKDEKAPIFEQADYGIVGDLYVIVPELIKVLKSRKG
jgi:electron transfer flavoprotein alpha subunit